MRAKRLFSGIISLIMLSGFNTATAQQWATNGTDIYNTNSGNVCVGTGTYFTPDYKFHIKNGSNTAGIMCESAYSGTGNHSVGNLRLKNSTTGDLFNITLRKNGTVDEMLQSCYIAGDTPPWREFIYFNFGTRKYEMRNGITDAEYQNSGNLLFNMTGNVGIGTTTPTSKLDLYGDMNLYYVGTGYGIYVTGSSPSTLAFFGNYYSGNTSGLSAGCASASADASSQGINGFNQGSGYAIYGRSSSGIGVYGKNENTGNYGYIGSSDYGVYGHENLTGNHGYLAGYFYGLYGFNGQSDNYGYIGGSNNSVYGYLTSIEFGDYALYGYGPHTFDAIGNGYGVNSSLGGVKGYCYDGNPYTFGVAGFSYLDYARSGGTFGGYQEGTFWGCLGYRTSSDAFYGGYFTAYTTGSGKSSQVMINSGIGAWGDLFGADIHGKIYGIYAEGENYATFSNGVTYRNNLDVNLQDNGTNTKSALYTNTSTEVTVMTSGTATLSQGKASIAFDKTFTQCVSSKEPVIVTVTPIGSCNGVFLANVNSAGFSVQEANAGKSSVTVNYIAIGKRAGYEKPQLSSEVIEAAYVSKLSAGLHNDNDMQTNGQGLYYENGQLVVGIHPSTLPDPNKPAKDPNVEKIDPPVQGKSVRPDVQKPDGMGDGAAPENIGK
jgi:hypothetical protein